MLDEAHSGFVRAWLKTFGGAGKSAAKRNESTSCG
jgi:hypothetical protein